MMFLSSVASELSNYDSCQSVHFCCHFAGRCNRGQSVGGSSRNGGGKKFVRA